MCIAPKAKLIKSTENTFLLIIVRNSFCINPLKKISYYKEAKIKLVKK